MHIDTCIGTIRNCNSIPIVFIVIVNDNVECTLWIAIENITLTLCTTRFQNIGVLYYKQEGLGGCPRRSRGAARQGANSARRRHVKVYRCSFTITTSINMTLILEMSDKEKQWIQKLNQQVPAYGY